MKATETTQVFDGVTRSKTSSKNQENERNSKDINRRSGT